MRVAGCCLSVLGDKNIVYLGINAGIVTCMQLVYEVRTALQLDGVLSAGPNLPNRSRASICDTRFLEPSTKSRTTKTATNTHATRRVGSHRCSRWDPDHTEMNAAGLHRLQLTGFSGMLCIAAQ